MPLWFYVSHSFCMHSGLHFLPDHGFFIWIMLRGLSAFLATLFTVCVQVCCNAFKAWRSYRSWQIAWCSLTRRRRRCIALTLAFVGMLMATHLTTPFLHTTLRGDPKQRQRWRRLKFPPRARSCGKGNGAHTGHLPPSCPRLWCHRL